jgi:hypothetical protein
VFFQQISEAVELSDSHPSDDCPRSSKRHEPVGRAAPIDVADAREWQVKPNHPGPVSCQAIEERLSGQHGTFGIVMIAGRLPLRMGERDSRMKPRS